MARRLDTQAVGDVAEREAARLLAEHGWQVSNLNEVSRNYRLHDLRASKGGRKILVSVKHARAKRQVRLGQLHILEELADDDFILIFLPIKGEAETAIEDGRYDVWLVPGSARHAAISAHLHYYWHDRSAASAHPVMIKDKVDRPGGRSRSGAAFQDWEAKFRHAWHLLPA